MTIHYHGTPINPKSLLPQLTGRHFCVSFYDPRQVEECHRIGQSVMLDNGAFVQWKLNPIGDVYAWGAFYDWVRPWLDYQTTWAVIPDCINGTEEENDRLIGQWFTEVGSYRQSAPVWHLHESMTRLIRLTRNFERVCFGSSGEYKIIGNGRWNDRMNEVFNLLCKGTGRPPCWIHMLRGMSLSGSIYPFASVDSTDIARNHHLPQNDIRRMANLWDAQQCPARWTEQPLQQLLIEERI